MGEVEVIGGPFTAAQVRISVQERVLASEIADANANYFNCLCDFQAACLIAYILFVALWSYAEFLAYRYAKY